MERGTTPLETLDPSAAARPEHVEALTKPRSGAHTFTSIAAAIVLVGTTSATLAIYARAPFAPSPETVVRSLGLGVTQVGLRGHQHTRAKDVFAALDIQPTDTLFTLSFRDLANRLSTLPWVETASLSRVWPNALDIAITERRPVALWQTPRGAVLLDVHGARLPLIARPPDGALMLSGRAADHRLSQALALRAQAQRSGLPVRRLIRRDARRWDLVLTSGLRVKLPAADPQAALQRLAALHATHKLNARSLAAVDLRFGARLYATPRVAPAEPRSTAVPASPQRRRS